MDGHMTFFCFFQWVRWTNRHINQALNLGSYAFLSQTYYLEHNIAMPVCFAAGLCLDVCLSLQIRNTDARLFAKDHTYTDYTHRRVNKEIATKPNIKRSLVRIGHSLCTVVIPSGSVSSVWREELLMSACLVYTKIWRRMVHSAMLLAVVILLVSLAIFHGFLKISYTGVT